MKFDLTTSVIVAIIGTIAGFFVFNLILPAFDSVQFKTVDNSSYSLAEPDPEVFNFRAVNPTVEVYVGSEEPEE